MTSIEPENVAPVLLPPQDEPLSADDAFARFEQEQQSALPDELFVNEEPPPPVGRSWAYDFGERHFVQSLTARGALAIHGTSTLEQWVEACMRTARGAHPIYENFGIDGGMGEFIGAHPVEAFPLDEFRDVVTEALTRHPRISDTDDWTVSSDPDEEYVVVNFTVVTDAGLEFPVETRVGD